VEVIDVVSELARVDANILAGMKEGRNVFLV